jgi:hypothetical protein
MEREDKSLLFGFHRFDPEINCQGLHDTLNINHRLNVIMRTGQAVKRGLQVPVTALYLKIFVPGNQMPVLKATWPMLASSSKGSQFRPLYGGTRLIAAWGRGWVLKPNNNLSKRHYRVVGTMAH